MCCRVFPFSILISIHRAWMVITDAFGGGYHEHEMLLRHVEKARSFIKLPAGIVSKDILL